MMLTQIVKETTLVNIGKIGDEGVSVPDVRR